LITVRTQTEGLVRSCKMTTSDLCFSRITYKSQSMWQLRFISQHFYLTLYSDDLMDSDTLC